MIIDSGDIILTQIQFVDSFELKTRPALVLFKDYDNIVVAGITSNIKMNGVLVTEQDGMPKDSVIKLNYIFTISKNMIKKKIISLSKKKRLKVYNLLSDKINALI